jgi:hypothetical protein
MFTPPRRNVNLFCVRHLHGVLIALFILANFLPVTATPVAAYTPSSNPVQNPTTQPSQTTIDQGGLAVAAPAATPGAHAADGPSAKTLPAHLKLSQDRALLTLGATMTLTISVYSDDVLNGKGLQLTLELPNGLVTIAGAKGKLRWAGFYPVAPGDH